jgi:hypothetical protein
VKHKLKNLNERFDNLKPTLIVVTILGLLATAFIDPFPASFWVAVSDTCWECTQARILQPHNPKLIYLHMTSDSRARGRAFTRLVVINASTGEITSEYLRDYKLYKYGHTDHVVWLKRSALGKIRDATIIGLTLPGLQDSKDKPPGYLSKSHPYASLKSSPEPTLYPPRMVGGQLLLDGYFLFDDQSDHLINFAGDDLLVAFQNLTGETGKLILGRLTANDTFIWQKTETQLFGERNRDDPGRRVAWATFEQDKIIMIVVEGKGDNELYVIALDSLSGKILWLTKFD